ncbi:MAG: ATP-dependent DNA ligase [Nanoarchaeota archaeon]|nr:ATP-dependent DNA ligase [Nanoarchaeota archaeon]
MLYLELCRVLEKLEATTKRLEKTYFISEFLKNVPSEDLDKVALFLTGRIFPLWDERKIGFSESLVLKAINIASGVDSGTVKEKWKQTGDLGKTAGDLIGVKKQATLFSENLTVAKVFANLRKLSSTEGQGSVDYKVKLVAELLSSASALEARYVVRTVLDLMRVGIGDGTIRDALIWSYLTDVHYNVDEKSIEPDDREKYNKIVERVQEAYDILNDFSELAVILKDKGFDGLSTVKLRVGKPIKVMLGPKEETVLNAFERVGRPAALEYKLDGFRMQIHKVDGRVKIFTRRLDEVTKQFPEVVSAVLGNVSGDSFILDCEAVGFDPVSGKFLPFQKISQRIKRKYDIHQMAKNFPVELNIFDIVSFEGEDLLKKEFRFRRELLVKVVKEEKNKIILVRQLVTDNTEEAHKFYQESLSLGNEGVMFKKLDGTYRPGARLGMMVKMKPVMETLDLVVVGAEWGEGKRSEWLSSFILACRGPDGLLEIGRTGTGFKEKEEEGLSFKEMTERLRPLIVSEDGKSVRVKPSIVLEINYEEIQASPTYGSGFALRFPRVVKVREDRGVLDCSSLEYVKELFTKQRFSR